MACAGYVSWNFSLGAILASLVWLPCLLSRLQPLPGTPGHPVQGDSDRLSSHKVSGSLSFGLPVPVGEFWQPKKSKVQAAASAVVSLQLHFIWARGEHLPPETPAGGSEAKFREQSLPPKLGVVPLVRTQPDNVLMGPRSSSRACSCKRGSKQDAGDWTLSSQQQSNDSRNHNTPNDSITSSM